MTSTSCCKLPEKPPTLRVVPLPAETNPVGDVFAGWVMAQVDIAGGIAAMRRAGGRVVTVSVNSFLFRQAVSVGDIVSFYADVLRVGNTSLTIKVEVFAERHHAPTEIVKVTEAELTYVSVDVSGNKRPVPPEAPAD